MPDNFKTVTMEPLTGVFDLTSSDDDRPEGSFAWKQYWEIAADGSFRQAGGFVKPYSSQCEYKNWDFHNQNVDDDKREPLTMFFPSTSNDGVRRLFAATKTRILRLNEEAGIWDVLGSGFADDSSENLTQVRFHSAELQNKVFFTNNFDKPQYVAVDGSAVSNGISSGALVISKAGVIISWQGVLFLMNIEEDGTRFASRIRWSDLNNGVDFDTSSISTISDYQDLDYGETILGAVPLLGNLYVFTDRGIWKCNFVIDVEHSTATLNCQKIYSEPRNQDKCLAYQNTLVSTGFSIFYAGRDAIYEYNPYLSEPNRVDWMYRSSVLAFGDEFFKLDKVSCASPIMEYWPERKEIHFSWPIVEAEAVDKELNCENNTPLIPVRGSGINRHTIVFNMQVKTSDYRDYGSTALVNFRSDILTEGSCNQNILFLGCNGNDFCIKQFGIGFSHEFYDLSSDSYSFIGYTPMLRLVFPFGRFDQEKMINKFYIDCLPDGDNGTVFNLRIGSSYKNVDPNKIEGGRCGVLWRTLSRRTIKCPDKKTLAQYATSNIRPTNNDFLWKFLYRGRFLFLELSISNANGSPTTGGGVTLTRFEVSAIVA